MDCSAAPARQPASCLLSPHVCKLPGTRSESRKDKNGRYSEAIRERGSSGRDELEPVRSCGEYWKDAGVSLAGAARRRIRRHVVVVDPWRAFNKWARLSTFFKAFCVFSKLLSDRGRRAIIIKSHPGSTEGINS